MAAKREEGVHSMKRFSVRSKVRVAVTVLAAGAGLLITSTPAHADGKVTSSCSAPWIACSSGDLWMLYSTKANAVSGGSYVTSWSTFYGNINEHYGTSQYQGSTLTAYRYVFNGNGKGAGVYTKNNAGSVQNCSSVENYRVYYSSGFGGTSQYLAHNPPYGDCNLTDLISARPSTISSSPA